jgi:hypothetical protein
MTKLAPEAAAKEIARERHAGAKVVFLCGSVVRGEATASSDLDLVVIYDSLSQAYRESFLHGQWPVETFVHDPQTLSYFFMEVDRPTGVPSLANMVAEGIALPTGAFAEAMKTLAAVALASGPTVWSEKDIKASRYAISTVLGDLQEPRSNDEQIATIARLYQLAADHFFRSQQSWSAHDKSIPRRFAKLAPEMGVRFSAAFRAAFERGSCTRLVDICEEILAPSGGRLFAEYRLDAPLSWRSKNE